MTGKIRDKKEQFAKTVKRLVDKDYFHMSMPDNSFRDYWSRQSHKGRMELIATAIAGLIIGAVIIFMLLQ
jgi:hypothetical protein